jgi:hypothetical protein
VLTSGDIVAAAGLDESEIARDADTEWLGDRFTSGSRIAPISARKSWTKWRP